MHRLREGKLRFFNHDPSGPHDVRAIIDHVLISAQRYADHVTVSPVSLSGFLGFQSLLTGTAYAANGQVIPNVTVGWSSDNPTIASVDSGGLVTFNTVGTCTISALVDGRSYTTVTVVSIIDEVTYLRTNIAGGDSSLRYLNSVRFNLTSATGGDSHLRMTQLQDARGNTFGQTYTPSTGNNGLEVVGSGDTLELQSSNASDMRTPAVASDAVGPATYAFIGTYSRVAPGGLSFPYGVTDDALSTSLLLTQSDGAAEKGGFEILSNPSAIYTHASVPRDGRRRLILFSIDATGLVQIQSPASATAPGPVYTHQLSGGQIPTATAVRRFFGGIAGAGFNAISTEKYRADATINRVWTNADLSAFLYWSRTHHKAINGSPVRIYMLGDSITAGYTSVGGSGQVDLSRNWSSLMLKGASYNGANPYFPLNFAVVGATIRTGTNAGNNITDQQLPLLATHTDPSASVCIVVIFAGTNAIAAGDTGDTATNDLWTLCAAVRALGSNVKIVVVPCIPRNSVGGAGGQTGFDTNKHIFNNRLASEYASHADAYASELLTIAPFNIDTGYNDASYFDGIHMLDYTSLASGISPAVLRVPVPV